MERQHIHDLFLEKNYLQLYKTQSETFLNKNLKTI